MLSFLGGGRLSAARILLFLGGLWLGGARSPGVHAQTVADTTWERTSFSFSVTRRASSEFERSLIATAESIDPDPREVSREARETFEGRQRWISRIDSLETAIAGPRWWYVDFDGTLIPYAVTDDAIAYYAGRFDELEDEFGGGTSVLTYKDTVGVTHADTVFLKGSFVYTASVTAVVDEDAPEAAFVASLEVDFSLLCGRLCGLWFHHSRRVFFDKDGVVLWIEGDEPAGFRMS